MNAKPNRKKRSRNRRSRERIPPPEYSGSSPQESVASLLQRLGQPRNDISELLVQRFREAAYASLSRGIPLRRVELDHWFISDGGKLRYEDPSRSDGRQKLDPASLERTLERLTEQFGKQLADAKPKQRKDRLLDRSLAVESQQHASSETEKQSRSKSTNSGRTMEGPIQPLSQEKDPATPGTVTWQARAMRARPPQSASLSAAALEQHTIEEDDESRFTEIQNLRRAELAAVFTDSLAERFGEHVRLPADASFTVERRTPQAITKDRPFNWNLVFGAVTTVVVLLMVAIGFYVSNQRDKRTQQELDSLARASTDTSRPNAEESDEDAESEPDLLFQLTKRPTPKVSDEFIENAVNSEPTVTELSFDYEAVMRRQKELQAADPTMDDLSSIVDAFEAPIDEAGRIEEFLSKTPIADEANADLAP
ncbi:MAG: hypothetical protein AAF802_30955, partial [Planctomycetota bacterium]